MPCANTAPPPAAPRPLRSVPCCRRGGADRNTRPIEGQGARLTVLTRTLQDAPVSPSAPRLVVENIGQLATVDPAERDRPTRNSAALATDCSPGSSFSSSRLPAARYSYSYRYSSSYRCRSRYRYRGARVRHGSAQGARRRSSWASTSVAPCRCRAPEDGRAKRRGDLGCPDHRYLAYGPGVPLVNRVLVGGEGVTSSTAARRAPQE